jgi:hypothetical protein
MLQMDFKAWKSLPALFPCYICGESSAALSADNFFHIWQQLNMFLLATQPQQIYPPQPQLQARKIMKIIRE